MSVVVEIKKNTHIVIKKDFLDALNEREREAFANLCDKIYAKYGNNRVYNVINEDEPYYALAMQIILDGEARKLLDQKSAKEYPDPNKLGPKKDQGA